MLFRSNGKAVIISSTPSFCLMSNVIPYCLNKQDVSERFYKFINFGCQYVTSFHLIGGFNSPLCIIVVHSLLANKFSLLSK